MNKHGNELYIFLIKKNQLDALILSIFWGNKTLHVSDSSSVHHQEFFTVHTAIHTGHADCLRADMYDIYHCCVYSEKLLMMYKGTVRNM